MKLTLKQLEIICFNVSYNIIGDSNLYTYIIVLEPNKFKESFYKKLSRVNCDGWS